MAVPPPALWNGHGSSPVRRGGSSAQPGCTSTARGGTEQEEQCQHSGTMRGREKHLQLTKGAVLGRTWPEQLDQQALLSTNLHPLLLPRCSSAAGCVVELYHCKSQLCIFSNPIFSGIDPVLAFGNWHSLYWQMFLICFKQCVQCDLFFLNSLHNRST